MNIGNLLSKIKGGSEPASNLLTGLGIEQVGKSIFLFFKHDADSPATIRLAKSTDGFEFKLVKVFEEKYTRAKINPLVVKKIQPRSEYFDFGEIEVEGVVKISQGNLVFYHSHDWPNSYSVGTAIFKNGRQISRSDTPIWQSNDTWTDKKIEFVGLAHLNGKVISYWGIDNDHIEAVIYPSFKVRSPEASKNIKVNLNRIPNNPIISPNPNNSWESAQTFNPGVILLDNKFHFLYRAIGDDGVSRLGYAFSENGVQIDGRSTSPVFSHNTPPLEKPVFNSYPSGGSWAGAEDPRLVRVDDEDTIYATYTACDGGLRVGLTSIKVDDFMNGVWNWEPPICISPPGQIHKNWVIFPEKIRGHYAILHAITPKVHIDYFDNLGFKGEQFIKSSIDPQKVPPQNSSWDKRLRGAGATPLKTKYGWLLFYHAMDYKVGVMLLDLDDPTKIICKSRAPILESTHIYENSGFKPGIVYVSGAVIQDGTLYVYYGGADSYVCAATADLDEFLYQLRYSEEPVLETAQVVRIL